MVTIDSLQLVPSVAHLIVASGLAADRGESRRLIAQRAVLINGTRVADAEQAPSDFGIGVFEIHVGRHRSAMVLLAARPDGASGRSAGLP